MIPGAQLQLSVPCGHQWTALVLLALAIPGCGSGTSSETGNASSAAPSAAISETKKLTNSENLGVIVFEPEIGAIGDVNVSTAGIETTFKLQNPGNSEIQILRVESTCGCTVASPASSIIAPHGETQILTAVSPSTPGLRHAAVRVFLAQADGNAKGSVQLRLKWNAVSPISMTPERIDAGRLLDSEVWNGSLAIATSDGSPINSIVKSVAASPANEISISTSLPEDTRDATNIDVCICGNVVGATDHKGTVVLKCREDIGTIRVPVVWKRVSKVYFEPAGIYEGQISPGTRWSSTFTLHSIQCQVVSAEPSSEFSEGFQAKPLTKSVWQITVAGIAPDAAGVFSAKVPIRIGLADGSERNLDFTATGVVR